jgi:TonB family protein
MQCSNCGHELRPDTRFCTKCGALAPVAPTTAPVPPAQPTSTFGTQPRQSYQASQMGPAPRKSGCGKVLLILAIIGGVVLVGVGVAGYYGYKYANEQLKSSEPYKIALAALKENPEAAEKLGEIKETGFPIGSFHEDANGTGAAFYKVSVTGTKTTGDYVVALTRRQAKWSLATAKLTLANGEVINIKTPGVNVFNDNDNDNGNDNDNEPPPPPPPSGKIKPGTTISGGVLNGQAISKPDPDYPAIARAAHASGTVTVQVTIDETGKVVSAQAVSGHPLLQAAAAKAAYQASFKPTLLAGQPVKVTGILTYNFAPQ